MAWLLYNGSTAFAIVRADTVRMDGAANAHWHGDARGRMLYTGGEDVRRATCSPHRLRSKEEKVWMTLFSV